jgi:hypothetical protein
VCNADAEYSCFINTVSVMVIILLIIIIHVKPFRIFLLETNITGSQAIPPMHRTINLISVFIRGRVVVVVMA